MHKTLFIFAQICLYIVSKINLIIFQKYKKDTIEWLNDKKN